MKQTLAGFIAGLLLGTAAIATAATAWRGDGSLYGCAGNSTNVACSETHRRGRHYEMLMTPRWIGITFGRSGAGEWIFRCQRRWTPADNCVTYRLPS